MNTLSAENSLVMIIDIQERLVSALDKDIVVSKAIKIASAAKSLGIPVLVTEQYPKGLGNTVPQLKEVLPANAEIVEKTSFNALLEDGMAEKIASYGKKQIVLFGIETHICVHQTAAALLEAGYEVYIIKDACASRSKYEFKQGIDIMHQNGAKISCVEIALFEWLKGAKNPKFKEVQALIK
uniref:isochorismatase family protein n=1 Tax=Candidatus Scatousia sp. TaxID=3085663 RepID=UPI0040276912